MISPGERVAVAVSGGKDSVTLLHLLAELGEMKKFEVVAISIDEGIRGYRDRSIRVAKENTNSIGIEHVTGEFERYFGETLDGMVRLAKRKKMSLYPCTYCGVMRRYLLNKLAREVGATKLATAHNLDDEVQAIMLNYIRGDLSRLQRLGPVYFSREGFVPRIKPLREIPEKEVAVYALLRKFKVHLAKCPYATGIHTEIRDFLNGLEARHPNSKFMILRTFDSVKARLSLHSEEFETRSCKICGEPTSSDVCKSCKLLGELGLLRP